jgi:hypothetical protein
MRSQNGLAKAKSLNLQSKGLMLCIFHGIAALS